MRQLFARLLLPKLQHPKISWFTHVWHHNSQSALRCLMKVLPTGRQVRCSPSVRSYLKVTQSVWRDKMFAAVPSQIVMQLSSIRTQAAIGSHFADSLMMTINSSSLTHCSQSMQRWALSTDTQSSARTHLFCGKLSSVISPMAHNLSSMSSSLARYKSGVSVPL